MSATKLPKCTEATTLPDRAADPATIPFVEGWLVPLELRVIAQVTPDNAPFVVASVGGLKEIEDNIMIPTIRSIVRNVVGAQGRHVLDLADNRAELEHAVEDAIRPEGLRAGIVIREVKFGDPALPPELLVSRLRPQRTRSGPLRRGVKPSAFIEDRNRKF